MGDPVGTANNATNCLTYPYQISYTTTGTGPASIQIRHAANGFIATKSYQDFVFQTIEQLNKWLAQELKVK